MTSKKLFFRGGSPPPPPPYNWSSYSWICLWHLFQCFFLKMQKNWTVIKDLQGGRGSLEWVVPLFHPTPTNMLMSKIKKISFPDFYFYYHFPYFDPIYYQENLRLKNYKLPQHGRLWFLGIAGTMKSKIVKVKSF